MVKAFTIAVFLLALSASGYAATIHVPLDQPTIQAGIDAAVTNDTVLVAPGTYLENIDFKGKAVKVVGAEGPYLTIIDGRQLGSVVRFVTNEPPDAVLDGFTLTNGSAVDGGGISSLGTSPTIMKNIIRSNAASMSGGGIFCYQSAPTITGNLVHDNTAGWSGGGINCSKSDSHVERNTIFRNSAGKRGGGIRFTEGSFILIDSIIFDNVGLYGGGIVSASNPSIIVNNLVHGNQATHYGGGMHSTNDSLLIVNCTFFDNSAGEGGGGFSCGYNINGSITNTILWENHAPQGAEIRIGSSTQPSTLEISFSNVKGGTGQAYVAPGCTLNVGAGMIDDDPMFLDPADNDFHIVYDSPCRDAGDDVAQGLPEHDLEGDPRIAYDAVDMGADEFHSHLYYAGDAVPGNTVDINFVGNPGENQVGLLIGIDLFDPPLVTPYGDRYVKPPMIIFPGLGPIPLNGVYTLPGTIPASTPGPYTVYFQALVGWQWTNLCTMNIQLD